MCKKFVFQIQPSSITPEQGEHLLHVNDQLHLLLEQQKNMITEHFRSKKWDKYKKHSNSYELIFTSCHTLPSIATYSPISRSYFKLWETLCDFESVIGLRDREHVKALFIAEGPGGFVEAFCNYRPDKADSLYGMTLISDCKNVPSWKVPEHLIKSRQIQLVTGHDGTGSLYNKENRAYLKRHVGAHSCDLITADGGFDFSSDFNSQEELSMQLITAEIKTALQIQKAGGIFILKIFDIHSCSTMKLISILTKFYDQVFITKPFTSRPANSEKYLVCTGYKIRVDLAQALAEMENLDKMRLDLSVLPSMIEYNTTYILRQCTQINKTLLYINCLAADTVQFKQVLRDQIKKALRWCFKYSVSINKEALGYYKSVL